MILPWEDVARTSASLAASMIGNVNPVAGKIAQWGVDVAFEIVDGVVDHQDPVAVAQHVGDRVAKLVEDLRLGSG